MKKTLFILVLISILNGCIANHWKNYCLGGELNKINDECTSIRKIVEALRASILYFDHSEGRGWEKICISRKDFLEGNIPTPWYIPKDLLKERLKWINCSLIKTQPFLTIKYKGKLFMVELRWLAKGIKITENERDIILDFSPLLGIGTEPKYGLFPLTVCDKNNVIWKCYLFDISNPCCILVDPFQHHTFEEDQERLKNYDLWKYYKEETYSAN